MSLKAGRRGLHKRLVDAFGNLNGETPSGDYYTKQQTDNKFETKTHASNTFQPKTLEIPIEMLSGSKLTVEDALQGLNEEKFTYADNGVLGAKNLYSLSSTHTFIKSTARTFESNKLNFKQGDTINVSFDISDVANFGGTNGVSVKFIDDSNNDVTASYDYGLVAGHYKHTFTINNTPTGQVRAYMFLMSAEPNDNATLKLSNIMIYLGTDSDDTYVPYAMTNREITEELTVQESVCAIVSGTATYNKVTRIGKTVTLDLSLSDVTSAAWSTIATLSEDVRPRANIRVLIFDTSDNNYHVGVIPHGGSIQCVEALSNVSINIHATWLTD